MTNILDMTWDDLVRLVAREQREQREADNKLFTEIARYLRDYNDEEIEGLHIETLEDRRQRGRKTWRGQCAFSFRVAGDKIYVREGDDAAKPEERFDNREAAYRRMAEHMLRTKDRARTASRQAA